MYQILTTQQLNPDHLAEAIHETFRNRNTNYTPNHALFSPTFPTDPSRLRQWKAFLSKSHLDQNLEFIQVLSEIKKCLFPIWEKL
jgi:hypothetical protein